MGEDENRYGQDERDDKPSLEVLDHISVRRMGLMSLKHFVVRRTWLIFVDMIRSSLTVYSPTVLFSSQVVRIMLMMRLHAFTNILYCWS